MGAKQFQLPMNDINDIIQEGNLKANKNELINQIEIARKFLASNKKEGLNHINNSQVIIAAFFFFFFFYIL